MKKSQFNFVKAIGFLSLTEMTGGLRMFPEEGKSVALHYFYAVQLIILQCEFNINTIDNHPLRWNGKVIF